VTSQGDGEGAPEELLEAFGAGDDGEQPAVDLGSLDQLKARIHDDMKKTQGGFREQGVAARAWPVAVATVLGVGFALSLSPASLSSLAVASVAGAAVAAALAIAAVLVAPMKPGLGERLALGGLGAGVVALGLQVLSGLGGQGAWADALAGSARCSGVMLLGAAAPLVLLALWVRRSGLPLRALHAAGLAVAAFAFGGLGIFRHCAPLETWHTLFAHLVAPATGATVAALLLYRFMQRRLDG
jgi:hypothetical protein